MIEVSRGDEEMLRVEMIENSERGGGCWGLRD